MTAEPVAQPQQVVCTARARSVHPECDCARCRPIRLRRKKMLAAGTRDEFTSEDAWAVLDTLIGKLKWTKRAIASATGLPMGTASVLVWEINRGTRRKTTPGTARAICTYGPPVIGRVGATGSIRRGRALMRFGYSRSDLAAELGLPAGTVNGVIRGDQERVHVTVAADFEALYARLLARGVGTSVQAAQEARERGWGGPGDWHGLDIDDPTVTLPDYPAADKPLPTRKQAARRRADVVRNRAARARAREAADTGTLESEPRTPRDARVTLDM